MQGRELYFLMTGELEVFQNDKNKVPQRLGFLSEGSFFGEAAVLADESGRELRRRTLRAVTDSELCFITRESFLVPPPAFNPPHIIATPLLRQVDTPVQIAGSCRASRGCLVRISREIHFLL